MKAKVQALREAKNMTQRELAEKSGLSLRTIQRVEAGNIPKGFTLKALSESLETEPGNLISDKDFNAINRAKLINISALSSLVLPFGNIILPSILIYKTKEEKAKEIGKNILSIQIIYTVILCILMMISPFIQKVTAIKIPLFIVFLIVMKSLNLYIILKNGSSLSRRSELCIRLRNSIL